MKRFLHWLSSWWFASMAPVHAPQTTLAQREDTRKRRLLSVMLLSALILILSYMLFISITLLSRQALICSIEVGILLFALWLNREGYLKIASVTFFFSSGSSLLLGMQTASLSDPFILLWACFLMTILLVVVGLFVPAWVIFLLAVVENFVLFWYLLVVCHTQIFHLLSSQQLQNFLTFLCMLIYESALVGVFYALTTRKAVIQADRAVELEQLHKALSAAHATLETAYATIQKQALTDGLTGLPNHRAIMDQFSKELKRAQRYHRPLSVLFFDADRFKRVNDTHGHAVGDVVLRQIGERTGNVLRGGDTLGRFGGEEFVVLLPDADADETKLVAERIRASVAANPVATSEIEGGVAMTVSIGLSIYPLDGNSEQGLLSQADEAMYVAKRLGRNQVRTAEEARQVGMDVDLLALIKQEEQYEAALREGVTPEHLRETYTYRMITSLLSLLELRNKGLSRHAHVVSDLATAIAQSMELPSREVSRIGIAALLHDIGKVALPDRLLQKVDSLSTDERTLLQEHVEVGAQILESSPFLSDLAPAVRHHHEYWDGSGAPDRLKGEDIPLAARIIAVAEAYDVMERELPHQSPHSHEEVMAELRRGMSKQFDPAVVQAFSAMLVDRQNQQVSLQTVG